MISAPASGGNPPEFFGYYAFTAVPPISGGAGLIRPGVRFYVLETSRTAGKALGHVEKDQLRWLRKELEEHPRFLAVVVSHHSLERIEEGGEELKNLLLDHPQVIALVCGHDHKHHIQAFRNPRKPGGAGFWQIQTSSLIDYPQQGRILEIYDRGNGTGAIRTFVFNQQASGQLGKNARASYRSAAQERFDGSESAQDRNVELLFQMPILN